VHYSAVLISQRMNFWVSFTKT